jgi:predicted small secreted protein
MKVLWILVTMLLLGMMLAMAGCNTVNGFGRDVERLGEKIRGEP